MSFILGLIMLSFFFGFWTVLISASDMEETPDGVVLLVAWLLYSFVLATGAIGLYLILES